MNLAGQLRPIVAALAVWAATALAVRAEEANDYPTAARAEYVYGCMKANGESRQAIEQCSCSIDVVASIVSYERYVTAGNRAQHVPGPRQSRRPVPHLGAGELGCERFEARAGRSRGEVFLTPWRRASRSRPVRACPRP
ncbi:hypothetical protein ACVWWR_000317 [Bradyrhizobium sp. LM3.2]